MTRLIIPEIPVGLNGGKGLLRMGHRARTKYNQLWKHLVREQIENSHKTPKGRQTVYVSQMRPKLFEDSDNLHASCKPILDALVAWALIKDDSIKHIDLRPTQQKGKIKTTIVVIEPFKEEEPCQSNQ